MHEVGKRKRHVQCSNGVPVGLTILSILTLGSCTGLLANRLHANNQPEVTEHSPGLNLGALCVKLEIFASIVKQEIKRYKQPFHTGREELLVIRSSDKDMCQHTTQRGRQEADVQIRKAPGLGTHPASIASSSGLRLVGHLVSFPSS